MKKILLVLLVTSLFLTAACAPQASEEELKEGLSDLSDEELDGVLEEAETDKSAFAGQAIVSRRGYTFANKRVSRDKLLIAAQSLKIERLQQQVEQISSGKDTPGAKEGIIVIDGSPGESVLPISKKVEGVPPIS